MEVVLGFSDSWKRNARLGPPRKLSGPKEEATIPQSSPQLIESSPRPLASRRSLSSDSGNLGSQSCKSLCSGMATTDGLNWCYLAPL